MERKEIWCLYCHTIFYDGDNCSCTKGCESSFLPKSGIGNEHAEGIRGSIPNISQNYSVGQIHCFNYPDAFSSSTYDGIQFQAGYLQNISDGTNSYLRSQQAECQDYPDMIASIQNTIFDSSLEPSNQVSFRGNEKNCVAMDCFIGAQTHTYTSEESTNCLTVSSASTPTHEFKKENSWSSVTKSMNPHFTLKSVLYQQEGLQGSSFSGDASSGEYCSTTGVNKRDLLFNTDSCRPKSFEGVNERNSLCSTNILPANNLSKNFYFVQRDEDKTDSLNLQSSPQLISENCDSGKNELADKDEPLESESKGHPITGSSHRKIEDCFELRDGRFFCTYPACKKSFTTKYNFTVHYRNHTGERPYACDKCPERFTMQGILTRHLETHSEERPYNCNMCEKRFFSQVNLDNHRQLIHLVERPYACDKCPKRFTEQSELTKHRRTHTGERNYSCDMCDKSFARKDNLNRHRKTHLKH